MKGLRTAKLRKPAWRVHKNPAALPSLPAQDEARANRFDDPRKEYRVRYLATNQRGAFLEVLSRFRTNAVTQEKLGAVKDVDEKSEPRVTPGVVPRAFLRDQKQMTASVADAKHAFVDVAHPTTQSILNMHIRHLTLARRDARQQTSEGAGSTAGQA